MGMEGLGSTGPIRDSIMQKMEKAEQAVKAENIKLEQDKGILELRHLAAATPKDRVKLRDQIKEVEQRISLNKIKDKRVQDVMTFLKSGVESPREVLNALDTHTARVLLLICQTPTQGPKHRERLASLLNSVNKAITGFSQRRVGIAGPKPRPAPSAARPAEAAKQAQVPRMLHPEYMRRLNQILGEWPKDVTLTLGTLEQITNPMSVSSQISSLINAADKAIKQRQDRNQPTNDLQEIMDRLKNLEKRYPIDHPKVW